MRFLFAIAIALLLVGCGKTDTAAPTPPARPPTPAPNGSSTAAASLPSEVTAFKERRDACDHFRGEEAYDAARAKELAAKLDTYCHGTDQELATLRSRYAGDANVISALKGYEDKIE